MYCELAYCGEYLFDCGEVGEGWGWWVCLGGGVCIVVEEGGDMWVD